MQTRRPVDRLDFEEECEDEGAQCDDEGERDENGVADATAPWNRLAAQWAVRRGIRIKLREVDEAISKHDQTTMRKAFRALIDPTAAAVEASSPAMLGPVPARAAIALSEVTP